MLFYFINPIARKIPLRPLFIITSAFLFAMAIKFIGEAVQEFQEQAMLPFTELKSVSWLGALGLNPTLEALSAQLLVIVFALATYSVGWRARTRQRCGRPNPKPSSAIAVHAAGVGQPVPVAHIGAAVIGALVVVIERPSIIARERR